MSMKFYRLSILLHRIRNMFSVALLMYFAVSPLSGWSTPPAKHRVLLLNSYHPGYTWSDEIVKGVEDTFEKSTPPVELYVEYLDSKRMGTSVKHHKCFSELLKIKYAPGFFDAIITSDDNAYQYFLKIRNSMFPKTPMVFCGINNFNPLQLKGIKNVTGIIQRTNPHSVIRTAISQNPQLKHITVICDGTASGIGIQKEIEHALNLIKSKNQDIRINLLSGKNLSSEELLKALRKSSSDGIGIVGVWLRDRDGNYIPRQQMYADISKASPFPIYGVVETVSTDGFLGQRIQSSYNLGSEAANIVLEIMAGTPASAIPIDSKDVNQFVFDWKQMQRWKISKSSLPQGAILLNEPRTFYDIYYFYIWFGAFALLIQFVIISLLVVNIIHRRRLGRELSSSRRNMRQALDLMPHLMLTVDINDNVLMANKAAAELFHLTTADIVGKSLRKLNNPPKLTELLCNNKAVINNDEYITIPSITFKDKNGVEREYSITKTPFVMNGVSAALVCAADNTFRLQAEQERKKTEAMYKTLFESSAEGIIFYNAQTRHVTHCNSAACQMLNYSSEELLERTFEEIFSNEISVALFKPFCDSGRTTNENSNLSEVPAMRKDNTVIYVDLATNCIDFEGTTCVATFMTDVTERQKSAQELINEKERLNLAINSSKLGMWDWYINTNSTQVNATWLELIGITREEYSHEHGFLKQFIHPEDIQYVRHALSSHIKGKAPLYEAEFRLNRNFRKWIWLYIVGKVVETDSNGHPTRMIGFIQDITERKNIETELRRAKNRAEESDRLKSSFLANMSHEIRTPLNAIVGFSNLLTEKSLDDSDKREYIKLICTSSEQLLNIISDILDLSKIESGQMTLHNVNVDVRELLRNIYSIFEQRRIKDGKTSVKLRLQYEQNSEADVISVDQTRLTQIFTNLLSNSFKFTESGLIEFGYRNCEPEITFYVKDTGKGISYEKQNIIFDQFTQEDNTITRKYGGTGLGLSICKNLVTLMGGRIWIESAPGQGTIFYFTLPTGNHDKAKEVS